MYNNNNKTFLLVACFFIFAAVVQSIAVLDKRVENPKPDGSGTVFIQIAADPADSDFGSLTGFTIVQINFPNNAQSLRLWNAVAQDCSGSLLTTTSGSNSVPADGKLCFISNTTVLPEFQSSFKFVAVGGSTAAPNGTVTIINYNKQACKGIPDLGGSGSFKAPPKPTVSITLSGLQIKFSVNATYLRNQTTWYLDFFDFNSAASGDSADGTGRTCCNHKPANYGSSFSNWWYSAVRATYNTGVHSSIDNALGSAVYPNYNSGSTEWTTTALDCSTLNFEATIPVSRLVGNATTDCHKTGSTSPAATTSGGLVYSGTLYVHAIRPIDPTNPAGGYYKSAFAYPFTFNLATTISNIVSTSAKWAFSVAVLNSVVTYTGGSPSFTMDLQTSIDSPTLSSPNVLQSGFALNSFPQQTLRGSVSAGPALSRLSDNGACTGASTSACVINWRMVMPQLSLAQLSNVLADFDTQYSGKYGFTWTTETVGDVLASDIYVDVSAVNPSTNLSTIPVNSSVNFFANQAAMQDTTNPGQTTPLFSSGEKIWVRHSFLVDPADIKAFVFNLKQAYVCFSNVPGFTPGINSGRTGCSVDIPGVMEAANGERYVLYDVNSLPGGIADVAATQPGQQSKVWGWTPIGPTDANWLSSATVNNGFSINAQPLAVDGVARTYYFHLISTVTQTALGRRSTRDVHHIVRVENGDNAGALDGVKIVGASASDASELSPALFNVVREMLW